MQNGQHPSIEGWQLYILGSEAKSRTLVPPHHEITCVTPFEKVRDQNPKTKARPGIGVTCISSLCQLESFRTKSGAEVMRQVQHSILHDLEQLLIAGRRFIEVCGQYLDLRGLLVRKLETKGVQILFQV